MSLPSVSTISETLVRGFASLDLRSWQQVAVGSDGVVYIGSDRFKSVIRLSKASNELANFELMTSGGVYAQWLFAPAFH